MSSVVCIDDVYTIYPIIQLLVFVRSYNQATAFFDFYSGNNQSEVFHKF